MRILVVSDTHRQNGNLCKVLAKVGKPDMLIHLGDAEGSEDYIREIAGCHLEIIAGNNDFFSSLPREKEIEIGSYHVLLTHGHFYNVSFTLERLREETRERGMQIAMFGHTHRPVIDQGGAVTLINPGSLSYPRQEGRRPSYIMMELDREGVAHYTINYL
ncbi:metallophosphoesterase family protein [Qiania dongpingensis]|uniref:Phosphoesterase n=1 Tax=Qiania dongpingensis TaxID=2763669 RepID=A0A7G9G723_9FIRM|nr:metallophosphoesterase [Qiania dongpingensis]QNM06605.1 metallophosphoesterase [Qiania dongpingensis]